MFIISSKVGILSGHRVRFANLDDINLSVISGMDKSWALHFSISPTTTPVSTVTLNQVSSILQSLLVINYPLKPFNRKTSTPVRASSVITCRFVCANIFSMSLIYTLASVSKLYCSHYTYHSRNGYLYLCRLHHLTSL